MVLDKIRKILGLDRGEEEQRQHVIGIGGDLRITQQVLATRPAAVQPHVPEHTLQTPSYVAYSSYYMQPTQTQVVPSQTSSRARRETSSGDVALFCAEDEKSC